MPDSEPAVGICGGSANAIVSSGDNSITDSSAAVIASGSNNMSAVSADVTSSGSSSVDDDELMLNVLRCHLTY